MRAQVEGAGCSAQREPAAAAQENFELTVPRNNHVRRTSSNTAVLACSTLRMRVLAWCTRGKKHVIRNNTAAPALMRRFGPRAAVNGVEAARGTRRKRRQLSKRGAFWIKHCLAWVKGIEPTSYDEVAVSQIPRARGGKHETAFRKRERSLQKRYTAALGRRSRFTRESWAHERVAGSSTTPCCDDWAAL